MKNLLVAILAVIGVAVYFGIKSDQEAQAIFESETKDILKKRDEERAIGTQVNAACRIETERVVSRNGGVILDWLGGRTTSGELNGGFEWFQETSTGYSKRILARVSGHSSTFTADCFTDKSFRVIDLQTFWQ